MDTGILDVLPVEATLIPKILLKLLLNEVHYGQPAARRDGEKAGSQKSGAAGMGARLARTEVER